jgi:glycosyltransferase involved in cell wall biosynthesis
MKILLSLHHPLDPNAGAASVTLSLGEAYKKVGHEVFFYSYDNLPKGLPGQLIAIIFPFYLAFHIIKLSFNLELDVIHASSGDIWVWGGIFRRWSFNGKPILVTQSHGLEHTMHERILEEARNGQIKLSWKYPLYNGSIFLWIGAASFRMADWCFLLNQYDAKSVKNNLAVDPDKIKLFPNAIPDRFIGLPFKLLSENEEIGIAFVGSYLQRKGIDYGIPALDKVMQKYPSLKVIFLGTACSVETVLNDFSTEVRNRVEVTPSFKKLDLPQLLANSHILLFPSLSEGFPLTLPESMACGLAPVATNIPGTTEIAVSDKNSILVPTRDAESIEKALIRLIDDRQHLNYLRKNAYESVQQLSWVNIAKQHLELYEKSKAFLKQPQIVN